VALAISRLLSLRTSAWIGRGGVNRKSVQAKLNGGGRNRREEESE